MIRNLNKSINPFHEIRAAAAKGQLFPGKGPGTGTQTYAFVAMEKNVANSFKHAAEEKRSAASGLMLFALPQGGDITDVCEKVGELELKWAEIMNSFADMYMEYRNTLKGIRERESHLSKFRERKEKAQDSISTLRRNAPNSSKIAEEEKKLAEAEAELLGLEIDLANFKRVALKEAFYLMFNGIHELGQKSSIISTYGKYVADMLDVTPVKPGEERKKYTGSPQTSQIVKDCQAALSGWQADSASIRRTITQSRGGHNPFVMRPDDDDDDDDLAPRAEGISLADDSEYTKPKNRRGSGRDTSVSTSKADHSQAALLDVPGQGHERAHSTGSLPSSSQSSTHSFSSGGGYPPQQQPEPYYNSSQPQQQQQQQQQQQPQINLYPPMDYNQYVQFYEQNNQTIPYQQFQQQVYQSPQAAFYQLPQVNPGGFYIPPQQQPSIPQPQIPQSTYTQQSAYQSQPQQTNFPGTFPGTNPTPVTSTSSSGQTTKKNEGWKIGGGRK